MTSHIITKLLTSQALSYTKLSFKVQGCISWENRDQNWRFLLQCSVTWLHIIIITNHELLLCLFSIILPLLQTILDSSPLTSVVPNLYTWLGTLEVLVGESCDGCESLTGIVPSPSERGTRCVCIIWSSGVDGEASPQTASCSDHNYFRVWESPDMGQIIAGSSLGATLQRSLGFCHTYSFGHLPIGMPLIPCKCA